MEVLTEDDVLKCRRRMPPRSETQWYLSARLQPRQKGARRHVFLWSCLPAVCGATLILLLPASATAGTLPTPEARGWTLMHGPIHNHSPYSHDACDYDPLLPDGSPNPECLAQLREAACQCRHDFIFFTDHPSNMQYYDIEDLVLYDPTQGDQLIYSDIGILANELTCHDGDETWTVWITTGTEGDHNMPIGLEAHLADRDLYSVGFGEDESLEKGQEEVQQIHDAGAVAMVAHAEGEEVTAQRMIDLGVDGIELYNAHANFEWMLSHNPLQILQLENWMGAGPGSPDDYDLVALVMIPYASPDPILKWDEVLTQGQLSAVIGTDVHQNVTLDPYCEPGSPLASLCGRLKRFVPNLESYLEVGGPIPMGDGERLDSYRRMWRWFSNHVLAAGHDMSSVKEALAHGRAYAAFDILGMPEGFDMAMRNEVNGRIYEMGDVAPFSPDLKLWITLPRVSMDDPYATWTPKEADYAIGRAEVYRINEEGSKLIANSGDLGEELVIQVTERGVYRVEIYMRPRHLLNVLGDQRDLAVEEFRWLWSNPIYVE